LNHGGKPNVENLTVATIALKMLSNFWKYRKIMENIGKWSFEPWNCWPLDFQTKPNICRTLQHPSFASHCFSQRIICLSSVPQNHRVLSTDGDDCGGPQPPSESCGSHRTMARSTNSGIQLCMGLDPGRHVCSKKICEAVYAF
jgi:hypothetical protein